MGRENIEYWMIYWGPGFLAVVWFDSSPTSLPPSPVRNLSLFLSLLMCRRWSLLTGGGGRSEGGAKSYDREKAWSSIYYPILSGKNVHHSFLDLNYLCSFKYWVHCTLCTVWTTQHDNAIQCQKRKLKVWWPNAYIFIFLLQYNIHTYI